MSDVDTSDGADGGGTNRPTSNGLTRVTVNLTPKSVEALESLSDSTGYSKTDIINRGLQLYKIINGFMGQDGGLIIKPEGKDTEIMLHIL